LTVDNDNDDEDDDLDDVDIDDDIDNNDDDIDNNDDDNTDNITSGSPRCGDKRPHSSTVSAPRWRKPVKVHVTTGAKPKAGDYEIAVQKVLGEAIPLYRGYLSLVTPYPGPIDEMRWAKKCWKDSCEECETRMAYNDEIIKLVSVTAPMPTAR